ncbi:phosphatidylinositol-specific phospholipase C domain-containing protein [Bacillus thuringiensis]|uniref:phosphatidylinositol-specific phospholipase C domain-containing protein n=1 Tax=Bacillus thuringiensis TaxID=1428 RepID=UPI002D7E216A|nr:phosphatidylinositol-specific phospholipase C domain-containing protein [Bacillus thuringiensis]MEB4814634.1 phosphatidylinositol-specific phospholipase C domain-containing protein [Bacillus thuringiensis]
MRIYRDRKKFIDSPSIRSSYPNFLDIHGQLTIDRSGFNVNQSVQYTNRDWMNYIPDSRRVSELSIPGTHDSMALYGPVEPIPIPIGDDATITQTMNLDIQLNSGIRYIDIRCRHYYDSLQIHHGPVYQHASFNDVLVSVKSFLTHNPRETILMRVKEEIEKLTPPVGNTRSFSETFKSYLRGNEQYFWDFLKSQNPYNPILGEARGKIILLQDFEANTFLGIPWDSLRPTIQDEFELGGRDQIYAKWEKVRAHFFNAMRNTGQIYLNHLSATGKPSNLWDPVPWFVASGYGGPQNTNLPRQLSGPSSQWPDNPRSPTSGFVYYGGTNVLSTRRIRERTFTHTGIVIADFPGKGLIDGTIALNFPGTLSGDFQIVTALNNSSVVDLNVGSKNVTLWENNKENHQRWNFTYNRSENAYVIHSVNNPELALTWDTSSPNRNVFATSIDSLRQNEYYWILEQIGNYIYIFKNKKDTNMVLTVAGGEIQPGKNLQVYPRSVGNAQPAQTFVLKFI